jgi:hypothetical protein
MRVYRLCMHSQVMSDQAYHARICASELACSVLLGTWEDHNALFKEGA